MFHTVDVSIPVYARNDTSLTSHATSWSVKKFNTLNVSACFGGPVNKQLPCAYDLAHILVRDVYTELDRLLNEREKDEGRGVVVLGQPGIGELPW